VGNSTTFEVEKKARKKKLTFPLHYFIYLFLLYADTVCRRVLITGSEEFKGHLLYKEAFLFYRLVSRPAALNVQSRKAD
jgi:hypothetical protein